MVEVVNEHLVRTQQTSTSQDTIYYYGISGHPFDILPELDISSYYSSKLLLCLEFFTGTSSLAVLGLKPNTV